MCRAAAENETAACVLVAAWISCGPRCRCLHQGETLPQSLYTNFPLEAIQGMHRALWAATLLACLHDCLFLLGSHLKWKLFDKLSQTFERRRADTPLRPTLPCTGRHALHGTRFQAHPMQADAHLDPIGHIRITTGASCLGATSAARAFTKSLAVCSMALARTIAMTYVAAHLTATVTLMWTVAARMTPMAPRHTSCTKGTAANVCTKEGSCHKTCTNTSRRTCLVGMPTSAT